MSFLAAASKRTTLSLKNILRLVLLCVFAGFLLYSFSFCDHTFSCWFLLFLASISLSCVGICSMCGISRIRSACSMVAGFYFFLFSSSNSEKNMSILIIVFKSVRIITNKYFSHFSVWLVSSPIFKAWRYAVYWQLMKNFIRKYEFEY